MVAPLLIIAGGVAGSVSLGYALTHMVGDKHYSTRDLAVDATMGLLPGVGYARPIVNAAGKLNIIRRMGLSRSMYSARELYMLPFVDESIQILYRTPLVGGSLSAISNIGANKSNSARMKLTSKSPKMRGETKVSPTNGKCPPGYFYSRKQKMCIRKKQNKKMYNKKRK